MIRERGKVVEDIVVIIERARRHGDDLSENCRRSSTSVPFFSPRMFALVKAKESRRDVNTNSKFIPMSKTRRRIPAPTTDDVLAASFLFTFVPGRRGKNGERVLAFWSKKNIISVMRGK